MSFMSSDSQLRRIAELLVSEWSSLQQMYQGLVGDLPSSGEATTLIAIEEILDQLRRAIGHLPKDSPASDSAMYRATLELGLDQAQDAQMMQSAFQFLALMSKGRAFTQSEIVQEFRSQLEISEEQAIAVTGAFVERYKKHVRLKS